MADVLIEGLGPECAFAGSDALFEKLPRLLGTRGGLLGEQQVGVRTVGRDRESLKGEFRAA